MPAASDDGVYWYKSGGVGLFVTEISVWQVLHPSLDDPRRGGGKRKKSGTGGPRGSSSGVAMPNTLIKWAKQSAPSHPPIP